MTFSKIFGNMALVLFILGLIAFVAPLLLAFKSWASSGFQGSMFSEGGEGHGTYLWFYFYLLPVTVLCWVGALLIKILGWFTK